ncbi:MAG TPA: ABC transporter permease [Nocardioidaceae bacterium]|nr:ABC transporter permease [Nocardioidaceae bacterium]
MSGTGRASVGRPPARLMAPAVLAVAFLVFPLVALLVRTPWSTVPEQLRSPALADALVLSLETSTAAMVVAAVVGTPLAWLLARLSFPGRSLLRVMVTVPLVLPPVVAGVALLTAFGRQGLLGQPLFEAFGITIPFTTAAVVIAHAFVALPFYVISVEGALRSTDREYDVVAATLGASRWTTFTRVTLPMALPGVLAGLVLGWARSIGEFGATITFAGNFRGTTQTMPLLVYTDLQRNQGAAIVVSVILLLVSVAVLALLRDRWFEQVTR